MKVYIIAGEPSGDLLASGLMSALMDASPGVEFRGVGGEAMSALRLESRFDISEISVMGFFEVLPRLPLITKRIRQTAEDISDWNPDVLVTVDSWGFVSALLTRIQKRRPDIPVVHYVAPQVWAWKKGRAKNVARLVDRLMTLLPDEGRYFEKYGLKCDFVGHPVIERMAGAHTDVQGFRTRHDIPADIPIICLLPGSRRSEINRLMPVLKGAADIMRSQVGDFVAVVPTVATVEDDVKKFFESSDIPVRVVTGTEERYDAFKASRIALAKSGTVSLELTAAGIPHIITYTFNPITNRLARLLVKSRFANLLNIIEGREIVPEFIIERCKSSLIASYAIKLWNDPTLATAQVKEAQAVLQKLRLPDMLPSVRAAQVVMETASQGRKKA